MIEISTLLRQIKLIDETDNSINAINHGAVAVKWLKAGMVDQHVY